MGKLNMIRYRIYTNRNLADLINHSFNSVDTNRILRLLIDTMGLIESIDKKDLFLYITSEQKIFDEIGETQRHNANIILLYTVTDCLGNPIFVKIAASSHNQTIYLGIYKKW